MDKRTALKKMYAGTNIPDRIDRMHDQGVDKFYKRTTQRLSEEERKYWENAVPIIIEWHYHQSTEASS